MYFDLPAVNLTAPFDRLATVLFTTPVPELEVQRVIYHSSPCSDNCFKNIFKGFNIPTISKIPTQVLCKVNISTNNKMIKYEDYWIYWPHMDQ